MGKKLSPAELELYERVDEVLHYVWDPIGVSGSPDARDECQAYLPHVFALLKKGASAARIGEYLDSVTASHIGLEPDRAATTRAVEAFLAWKRKCAN